MIDLDKLEELAKAATPGPWEAECDDGEGTIEVNAGSALTEWTDCGDGIRVGRPARSWRSTDRIIERDDLYDEDYDQAEADAEFVAAANPAAVLELIADHRAALARLAKVEALHQRVGAPWQHIGGVYVCRADNSVWPCPTVRALAEGGNDAAV